MYQRIVCVEGSKTRPSSFVFKCWKEGKQCDDFESFENVEPHRKLKLDAEIQRIQNGGRQHGFAPILAFKLFY